MKKRILAQWNSYRRAVLHPNSPPGQVHDILNAFYGGAVAMFSMITGVGDCSESKGVNVLEEISSELKAHGEEAKRIAARPSILIETKDEVQPLETMGILEIEEYSLSQWHPTDDGSGKPEQLHLILKIRDIEDMSFALRFKSRRAWETLTAIGDGHADQIWSDGDA